MKTAHFATFIFIFIRNNQGDQKKKYYMKKKHSTYGDNENVRKDLGRKLEAREYLRHFAHTVQEQPLPLHGACNKLWITDRNKVQQY